MKMKYSSPLNFVNQLTGVTLMIRCISYVLKVAKIAANFIRKDSGNS